MLRIVLQLFMFVLLAAPGLAEDWVVSRARGTIEQKSASQWVPLQRGMAVLDGAAVRTGPDGRMALTRGAETIELDRGTEIVLREGSGRMTSIVQTSGILTADVEKRSVQHFSVQTPFAAAVVKGTKFRVAVGRSSAQVVVERGTVQVQDTINDLVVDIVRGQQAEVGNSQPLEVSGPGAIAVFTFEGQRVVNGTIDVPADDQGAPVGQTSNNPNNNGSNNHVGNGHGNNTGNGHSGGGHGNDDSNDDNGNGGGNGNGNSGSNNGNGNGNSGSGNSNGDGNGNSGSGNGNGGGSGNSGSGNGNGDGNGNSQSGSGNGGNGNSGGKDNSGGGNGNGGGNGGGNK